MSKRILRVLVLVALSTAAAAVVSLDLKSNASQTQRAAVAKSNSRNASIVATTAAVLQETSEIRQLAILRPVRSGAQSRAEIEKMLVKNLNDQIRRRRCSHELACANSAWRLPTRVSTFIISC